MPTLTMVTEEGVAKNKEQKNKKIQNLYDNQ
jgi:hypothetical protein